LTGEPTRPRMAARVQSWIRRIEARGRGMRRRPAAGLLNQENRDDWIRASLQALPAGARLLDAGAGQQPYRAACGHLRYVAQDLGRYDGRGDGRGLQAGSWTVAGLDLVCDIRHVPEPDESFDAILCSEVLEHVTEPVAVLGEFARLLRPGGTLLLTAPFVSFTHFAPEHYHTGFSRYFYEHHLAALEFEICELMANGSFFELLAQEVRRIPWVTERYGTGALRRRDRRVLRICLGLLDRLARTDRGSAEFAAYGFHVRAVRRRPST
jgi:SAM-dependent methyltransferase